MPVAYVAHRHALSSSSLLAYAHRHVFAHTTPFRYYIYTERTQVNEGGQGGGRGGGGGVTLWGKRPGQGGASRKGP
jgi:hypothetical protein